MMKEQQIQPAVFEKNGNGKYTQPLLPIYTTNLQENDDTDEWDLRQILAVVRRRGVLIGGVAIALSATISFWTLTRQPKYEGNFQLLVEPVTEKSKLEDLSQIPGINAKLPEEGLDYESQIKVLRSPELMAPIIKQISTRYPDITYKSLFEYDALKLQRSEETKVLEINYQGSDQQKILFVLQQLSKGFLKYSLEERQTNLRQGIQFVDLQLPKWQLQVNNFQKELQQLRQQYNFIDPEVKAEQLAEEFSTIKLQRLDTEKQLAQTRALYAALQGSSGAQLAQTHALSSTLQNLSGPTTEVMSEAPVYQKLVAQLRDVESQIGVESTKFREDSPTVQRLRQKRENLLPILRQEAQRILSNKLLDVTNQISLLEVKSSKISQAENSLNQQLKQLPTLARRYTDLQRELKVATESLNRFMEKRQSLQIETAQKEIPWQVIAIPQVPEEPISPNVPRNLFFGAIAGLFAGFGAALLAERLDNVFHSPDELKEVIKLPLLGLIPYHKHLKQVVNVDQVNAERKTNGYKFGFGNISTAQHDESYFPFIEAFHSLHTNIGFLGSDTPIHSLAVSSALPTDGKSTVASRLAQAAAAMGQRVLLVDADLRLPKVHTLLGLSNEQGLSNVISSSLPISRVIQQSPLSENLFVLTAGQIPPDPIKLLSSKKMQNIMEQLRQEFDLVIYDTPPLIGLADSSILATHTDGIMLVVRMGKTDRSLVMQALERLKISRATVLGAVSNCVKNYDHTPYSYYYRPYPQNI